ATLREVLQPGGADVGTGRAQAAGYRAQHVCRGASIGNLDGFAFGRAVVLDAPLVLLLGLKARHAVEAHRPALAVGDNPLSFAFIRSGQHAPEHHEVGSRPKSLGHVSRSSAAAIGTDMSLVAMSGVGAFQN